MSKLITRRNDQPPVKRNGCCSANIFEANVYAVGSVGRVAGGLRHVPHQALRQCEADEKKGDDPGKAMTDGFGRSDDWTALLNRLSLERKITLSTRRGSECDTFFLSMALLSHTDMHLSHTASHVEKSQVN